MQIEYIITHVYGKVSYYLFPADVRSWLYSYGKGTQPKHAVPKIKKVMFKLHT
jgi:hypothetical protein